MFIIERRSWRKRVRGDGCLTSSILFKYERSMGTLVCSELGQGATGCPGSVVSE